MRKIDQVIIHSTATNPSWYSDKSAKDVLMKLGAGMWMKESGKILATTIVFTAMEKLLREDLSSKVERRVAVLIEIKLAWRW